MLSHDHRPGAPPSLVFIHGWMGNRHALQPISAHFPAQDQMHVDLLGHGQSPAWTSWHHGEQAEALLETFQGKALLIGHSMGAQIAIEAAHMAPDRVEALVLLDAAPIVPHRRAVEAFAKLRARFEAATPEKLPEIMRNFASNMLRHGGPKALVDDAVESICQSPPDLVRNGFAEVCDWQGAEKFAALQCPILAVNAPGAANQLEDLRRANSRVMGGLVVGSGHMVQIEAPEQVAAMIKRFAEVSRALILR